MMQYSFGVSSVNYPFKMLKDTLISAPILKYPDTSKPYTIFTDASKYGLLKYGMVKSLPFTLQVMTSH